MSRPFFRAELRTRHFHFEAFGRNAREAAAALERGLFIHAKQYGLSPLWHSGLEPTITRMTWLQCSRDGELLHD